VEKSTVWARVLRKWQSKGVAFARKQAENSGRSISRTRTRTEKRYHWHLMSPQIAQSGGDWDVIKREYKG
jgi:hypothetical protein